MSVEDADLLQDLIEAQQTVSTQHERLVQKSIEDYVAFRESDRSALKILTNWPADRDLIVDPLAERIAEAFADFLFGEDPVISVPDIKGKAAPKKADKPKDDGDDGGDEPGDIEADAGEDSGTRSTEPGQDDASDDQERLNDIIDENNLASELHEAEKICCSEGEVWWRVYKDSLQSDHPVIDWHSRSHVRPLWRGRRLVAAAFVSDIWAEKVEEELVTYKYVEIQTEGYTRSLLYRGLGLNLGVSIPLSERPETASLRDEWQHDLGMMCGRIVNRLGRDRRKGTSDYEGIRDLLMSLNEATTIGHENARLTLKKRLAVPREALGADGKFDAELGKSNGTGKFAVLEYSFDAEALITYKNDLSSIILTRVGLARQLTDPNQADGSDASGTALRVRLIPTTMAAKGKMRSWNDNLPTALMKAQQLDDLDEQRGGFGRPWKNPAEPPTVELGDPLPVDRTEETQRHAVAVQGEFMSRFLAIKEEHPEWDDKEINEELDRIFQEVIDFSKLAQSMAGGGGGPEPPPPPPGNNPQENADLAQGGGPVAPVDEPVPADQGVAA
jgi:hypothetical protein